MNQLLSVLVPIAASTPKEYYLKALQSIAEIDFDIEVVVQQDGDGEINLKDFYNLNISFAKNESGRNFGAATTRTAAFIRSTGDLIISLDADDYFIASGLNSQFEALDCNPDLKWATGQARRIINGKEEPRPCPLSPGVISRGQISKAWQENNFKMPVLATPVMFRREMLSRAGGWPALQRSEDVSLLFAVSDNYPGFLTDDDFYAYRKWPGQTTVEAAENQETVTVARKHRKEWADNFSC